MKTPKGKLLLRVGENLPSFYCQLSIVIKKFSVSGFSDVECSASCGHFATMVNIVHERMTAVLTVVDMASARSRE